MGPTIWCCSSGHQNTPAVLDVPAKASPGHRMGTAGDRGDQNDPQWRWPGQPPNSESCWDGGAWRGARATETSSQDPVFSPDQFSSPLTWPAGLRGFPEVSGMLSS